MGRSKFWNTVTPFSKTLAFVLFISLPFVGFVMGMKYKEEVYRRESVVDQEVYVMPFQFGDVTLVRTKSETVEGSFWGLPIVTKDTLDKNSVVMQKPGRGLYYGKNSDTFYDLQPGGYSTFRLVRKNLVDGIRKEKEIKGTSLKNGLNTKCETSERLIGNITATALRCDSMQVNLENPDQVLEQYLVECYLPMGDRVLAFEQPLKPMGDIDLCLTLEKLGVNEVYFTSDL